MRACFHIEITTPKKVVLNALWFGPKKPKRAFIMLHGLAGSIFSMRGIVDELVGKDAAVLTINTRGFEQITTVKRNVGKKSEYITAGTTHEIFTDSADDIQGAINAVRRLGIREVYVVGHSTGCNKAIYWASRRSRGVNGIILLGPLSDYSGALKSKGEAALKRAVAYARRRVAAGKPDELMPPQFAEWFACDAQRFLSLYTPESAEEIFTYARPAVMPSLLRKTRLPVLVLLAGADEYGDMPAEGIAEWFLTHIYEGEVGIVRHVGHGFKRAEKEVAARIRTWVQGV